MNTETETKSELHRVFGGWRQEDGRLAALVDETRDWMSEVNQLGIPHFGETAARLEPLRDHLQRHFDQERRMIDKLAELYPTTSPEVRAFRHQTLSDQETLVARLDDLHRRLMEIDPPFQSWTEAMQEVDVLFEAMQQHELREADRVDMLMPR